ncbi:MAG TPA: hypothetical protein VKV25_06365, partial [Acidimicrobiales bacterium]|nr:hypothetical protein [Acidimicrobiales bacterium]
LDRITATTSDDDLADLLHRWTVIGDIVYLAGGSRAMLDLEDTETLEDMRTGVTAQLMGATRQVHQLADGRRGRGKTRGDRIRNRRCVEARAWGLAS